MSLDLKLSFDEYLESVLSKIRKTIGLLRKFQSILSRMSLLKNYKSLPDLNLTMVTYYMTRHLMNPSMKGLDLYNIMEQLQ